MESERPLISPPEATSLLRVEYSNSPDFLAQIDTLINRGYKTIIRAKGRCSLLVTRAISQYTASGDGDCFYRGDSTLSVVISIFMHISSLALAYAYLDRLITSRRPNKGGRLATTADMLAKAGFDDCVYGQPYEILQGLLQPRMDAKEELWQSFLDAASTFAVWKRNLPPSPFPLASNYIVMYMRLLTSAQMRVDGQFADFLFDPESQMQTSVDDFCRRFVEPLGKEAGGYAHMLFSNGLTHSGIRPRPGGRPLPSVGRSCQGCLPGWTRCERSGQLCRFFGERGGWWRTISLTLPVSNSNVVSGGRRC